MDRTLKKQRNKRNEVSSSPIRNERRRWREMKTVQTMLKPSGVRDMEVGWISWGICTSEKSIWFRSVGGKREKKKGTNRERIQQSLMRNRMEAFRTSTVISQMNRRSIQKILISSKMYYRKARRAYSSTPFTMIFRSLKLNNDAFAPPSRRDQTTGAEAVGSVGRE